MANIVPYINFADQGKGAIEFYQGIFGGDAEMQLVKDSPNAAAMPPEWGERIFHLAFTAGDIHFYGSDIMSDQAGKVVGNVYSLVVNCDSEAQLREWFPKLAEGGNVAWEPRDSEWGSVFAQVSDKYGVTWMLNYQPEGTKEK